MSDEKKNRILTAARSVFLRYGFKRVNMADLAEAAGVSRPALYILFRNKEEIFAGVYLQWVDETIAQLNAEIAPLATPLEQLERAFEVWTIRPFEMTMASSEVGELLECSFGFALPSQRDGYAKFEAAIVPIIAALAQSDPARVRIAPERAAHILAGAARGLKQAVATPGELRDLVKDLLVLAFGTG